MSPSNRRRLEQVCTFAIISLAFLPPLIMLVVRLNASFAEYELVLSNAKARSSCIQCYMENQCSTCPEQCSERLDMHPCQKPTSPLNTKERVATGDLENVIRRTMNNFIKGEVKRTKHISQFRKLRDAIASPKLPMAHLTADGQPTKSEKDEYTMSSWKSETGAKFAFSSDPTIYSNGSSYIQVPHSGMYIVYVHTTFVSDRAQSERCQVTHFVKRNPDEMLMSTTESVSNCGRTKQTVAPWLPNKPCGFHTLDTVGTFSFAKGERLYVSYSMPSHVTIGNTDTQTYFGIFRI